MRIALQKKEPSAKLYSIVGPECDFATDRHRNLLILRTVQCRGRGSSAGRIIAVAVCALRRHEYPSERASFDEVSNRLSSRFERKCLRDDRLDLARLEKLCDRRPCFCPKQIQDERTARSF